MAIRPHSVKSFTILILTLAFCCLAFLGGYALFSLAKIRASNESYQNLLDQPRNAAAKVRGILQGSVDDLYSIDPEAWDEKATNRFFSKTAVIWEPVKFNKEKKDWDDTRFAIPLYREISIEEVSDKKCHITKYFRNSESEKRYRTQPTNEKLFPFDDPCRFLNENQTKTYISKRLAWFITREEQMAEGAVDPGDLKEPIPVMDGVVRIGRRIEKGNKTFLVFLSLDSRHLQEQAMHLQPYPLKETAFPKYLPATYTILYDNDGDFMFHPKLFDLPGYYADTKKPVPYDQGEMGPELPLPYRYEEFQQYPPKIKDLFFADGKPDGITIDSYKNVFSNQVKTQVHAPIFLDLPGTKERFYYGIVALGLRNIQFIERATAFNRGLKANIDNTTLAFGIVLLVLALIFVLLAIFWWKRFSSPLLFLVRELLLVKGGKEANVNIDKMSHELREFQLLAKVANEMLEHIQSQGQELLQRSLQERSVTIAAQVLHDIRSPVMALEVLSRRAAELPEDLRVLLRQSIQRIQLLVDDLKVQQSHLDSHRDALEASSPVDVIVSELLQEKKMEYTSRTEVALSADLEGLSFGTFSVLSVGELKRVLSNLINNAYEALTNPGTIEVKVVCREDRLFISIQDSGRGIPSHVLSRISEKGFSFEKPNGTGLGLSHAKELLEKKGGSLTLTSEVGQGTIVTLICPVVARPVWFAKQICIPEKSTVVVLDDDPSIHSVWNRRLAGIKNPVEHFYNENEFLKWHSDRNIAADDLVILVDYELTGSERNGLEIIQAMGLSKITTLVSFRYADKNVQVQAAEMGVSILPKNLSTQVPISSPTQSSLAEAILVDDDSLTRMLWKQRAEADGIKLHTYADYEELEEDLGKYPTSTSIFVDWHLHETDGREVARKLQAKGYSSVTMSSGMAPSGREAGQLAWIDKNPPWSKSSALALPRPEVESDLQVRFKLAHDLRPVVMAIGISLESIESLPQNEKELLEESLERLRKIVAALEAQSIE